MACCRYRGHYLIYFSSQTVRLMSGDNAVFGKQGLLFVLGRSDYMLKSDGEVIIPCTIEDFLETPLLEIMVNSNPTP